MSTTMRHAKRNSRAHQNNQNHLSEMREHVSEVGEAMRGMVAAAGSTVTDQLDPLQEYIKAKPLKSLLIAAGAGAVLSFIFLRR